MTTDDDDTDTDEIDLLDADEADEIRSELGVELGKILARRGLKGTDASKLFAPPKATVSPAAAAALASFAVNTAGTTTHEATVAAQRAGVDRINAETLAARTAERLAGRI